MIPIIANIALHWNPISELWGSNEELLAFTFFTACFVAVSRRLALPRHIFTSNPMLS